MSAATAGCAERGPGERAVAVRAHGACEPGDMGAAMGAAARVSARDRVGGPVAEPGGHERVPHDGGDRESDALAKKARRVRRRRRGWRAR